MVYKGTSIYFKWRGEIKETPITELADLGYLAWCGCIKYVLHVHVKQVLQIQS